MTRMRSKQKRRRRKGKRRGRGRGRRKRRSRVTKVYVRFEGVVEARCNCPYYGLYLDHGKYLSR